jgi:Mg2+/Co2+ transporter CorC
MKFWGSPSPKARFKLGRIPQTGETIEENDFLITIQSASERQLHMLKVFKN